MRLGGRLDLLRGDVEHPLHGGQGELGVAEQHGVPAQFVGAARDRAEPVQPLTLQLGLRTLHFLGRGALGREAGQLLVDGRLDLRHLDTTGRLDVQPAQGGRSGEPEQPESRGHRRTVAADQAVVQPGRLAAAEDGQRQVSGVTLAGAVVRQPVGGHQRTRGDLLVHHFAQLLTDGAGQRAVARRLLAVVRGDGAEVLLDPGQRLLRVDVADHREHGVVGRVVRAEERLRVVQGRRVQIGHRADRRVVVRVALRVREGRELLERRAVRNVVVALAALVLHDVALVLHGLVVERGEQRAHPVGLEPQGELQLVRGHRLEVVGALEAGGAVEGTHAAPCTSSKCPFPLTWPEPWNIRCSKR